MDFRLLASATINFLGNFGLEKTAIKKRLPYNGVMTVKLYSAANTQMIWNIYGKVFHI